MGTMFVVSVTLLLAATSPTVLLAKAAAAAAGRSVVLAPTITIAHGVEMPVVALGTGEYQSQAAIDAVQSAIRIGYRAIDTAHEYSNQQAIGQGIREMLSNASYNLQRSDLFIISKVEVSLDCALWMLGEPCGLQLGTPVGSRGCTPASIPRAVCTATLAAPERNNIHLLFILSSILPPPSLVYRAGLVQQRQQHALKWTSNSWTLDQPSTLCCSTTLKLRRLRPWKLQSRSSGR